MARAVKELRAIPFGYLIGEPMKAAIEAQALAARTTIEFIEKVGFVPHDPNSDMMLFRDPAQDADAGRVRNVTFTYSKKVEPEDTDDTSAPIEDKQFELTVPILTIVPIPYLRIDEMTIDFTAKLTDMIESGSRSAVATSAATSGSYRNWWSPLEVSFRAQVAATSERSTKAAFKSEYTMNIHVRAVQDDVPGGLARVLDLLEQGIKETPQPAALGAMAAPLVNVNIQSPAAPAKK
ncbi:DUF2589 domain-containing protein [Haliangium sp.]|uniref:DUF2589 domain-containing protein n=1 Tax=Haliangium sp. TaxID=2663208 RepID=UPI003D14DB4E